MIADSSLLKPENKWKVFVNVVLSQNLIIVFKNLLIVCENLGFVVKLNMSSWRHKYFVWICLVGSYKIKYLIGSSHAQDKSGLFEVFIFQNCS